MSGTALPASTIDRVIAFHGHLCPGLMTGVRAAEAALRRLGPRPEDEELVAVVETDNCAVDAIQYLAGCTLGKANLVHLDHGKTAFTFARRSDGRAIRIVARPRERRTTDDEDELIRRVRAGEGSDEDRMAYEALWRERSRAILAVDEEELFEISEVEGFRLPEPARIHPSLPCDGCGEMTMATRITTVEGRRLCTACAGAEGVGVLALRPIGVVHNELRQGVTPSRARSPRSVIAVYREFSEGLAGLEAFETLEILFWFDRAPASSPLLQRRRGDPQESLRGVFTLRSPHRPNPIGLTTVELLEVREGEVVVSGLDAWDGTPVLDIKPGRRRG